MNHKAEILALPSKCLGQFFSLCNMNLEVWTFKKKIKSLSKKLLKMLFYVAFMGMGYIEHKQKEWPI